MKANVFPAVLFLLALHAMPLSAATFTVNSTADLTDASPGDGICETATGNGICTLRAAIQETNALPGADTVVLPAGTYVLAIPRVHASVFWSSDADGDLEIENDLTIMGAGAGSTIIAGGPTLATSLDRVFTIGLNGLSPTVLISGVTIENGTGGAAEGCTGGGALLTYYGGNVRLTDSVLTGNRGGMCNYGTMTVDRTSVTNNTAPLFGGGVVLLGDTTVRNSTISGNHAIDGGLGYGGFGGGIVVLANGDFHASITNSTISGNTADSAGGGIYIVNGFSPWTRPPSINSVTVANNNAPVGGGIATCRPASDILCSGYPALSAQTTQIRNSIVAANAGGNCIDHALNPFNSPASLGYNLDDAALCGFASSGDRVNTSAGLGPLAFNGGQTQTHALLAGSSAIDAGDPAGCTDDQGLALNSDQRGSPRSVNAICDGGSYEVQQQLGTGTASVATATGAGPVTFSASAGSFGSLDAIASSDIPSPPPNGITFPFGLFSWTLSGLTAGQTVTVTLTYPSPVASPAAYWKISNGTWTDVSSLLGSDNGDNVLTLTVTDGGPGDSDGVANGQISDPGGIGIARHFAAFTASVNIQRRELGVSASFQLAPQSNGIDPANETVELQIGTFSVVLPPHALRADGRGGWAVQGVFGGTRLEASIRPRGARQFDLQAQIHDVNLAGIAGPTTVRLAVGDDEGDASVVPRVN